MLRAARHYSETSHIIVLLPKDRLPLPLDGDTDEEREQELIYQAGNIYEQITSSPHDITYRFVRWFCKVFRTEIPAPQMLKILTRTVKREYRTTL